MRMNKVEINRNNEFIIVLFSFLLWIIIVILYDGNILFAGLHTQPIYYQYHRVRKWNPRRLQVMTIKIM